MKRAKLNKFRTTGASISLLAHRTKSRFCIAVVEEMGINSWIWFPPVEQSEFEAFWEKQPSLGLDAFRAKLGGEWIQGHDDHSCKSGELNFKKIWQRLYVQGRYVAELCTDSNSYIQSPDGRVLMHAGCDENFRTNEAAEIEGYFRGWQKRYLWGWWKNTKGRTIFPKGTSRREKIRLTSPSRRRG